MPDAQIDALDTVPSGDKVLAIERLDHGVVLLRLNLPDRRNAMTDELSEAWQVAIGQLGTDPDLRVVVVTGEGKAFSAGGELAWLEKSATMTLDQLRTRMLNFYRAWLGIRTLDVPSIAALNGAAVGAGLAMA